MASDHCAALLDSLGWAVERRAGDPEPHPDLVWATSGAMALTGPSDGPPLLAPAPVASCARGAVQALRLLTGTSRALAYVDGARLLGEHAACLGLRRRGTVAPSGSCRLLPARDGWLAINLARASDVELLPAWLGPDVGEVYVARRAGDAAGEQAAAVVTDQAGGVGSDRGGATATDECGRAATNRTGGAATDETWAAVTRAVVDRRASELVDGARLLGMPVALAAAPGAPPPWLRVGATGPPRAQPAGAGPLVIDLSALWAGPLAARLLGLAGARVIKVESTRRPDGARHGSGRFYDVLNAGKESVALDLSSPAGLSALRRLIAHADIVLESARPRALAQLGIEAASLVQSIPGLVWVSITGYGRREPEAGWVAFGDDAAVAAGLAMAMRRTAGSACCAPLFCGDAIADPLTGMHAAVAALAAWLVGHGALLDLALRDVIAHVSKIDAPCGVGEVTRPARGDLVGADASWEVAVGSERAIVSEPSVRPCPVRARALGVDTGAVLQEIGGALPD